MHNYHSALNTFPMGASNNPTPSFWASFSSLALMLPYMENKPLYDAINFSWSGEVGENATASNTVVNFFLCPSDGNAGKGPDKLCNYVGSIGTTTTEGYPATTSGMFALRAFCKGLNDVTDGSSQTIAFSEILVSTPNADNTKRQNGTTQGSFNANAQVVDASLAANLPNVLAGLQTCSSAVQANTAITNLNGRKWAWGNMAFNLFNTVVPPNSKQYKWTSCRNNCGGCNPDDSAFVNANSNHPGNVQVLMGDGSVRSVKDSIQMPIWMALGTVANGETVSNDSF